MVHYSDAAQCDGSFTDGILCCSATGTPMHSAKVHDVGTVGLESQLDRGRDAKIPGGQRCVCRTRHAS